MFHAEERTYAEAQRQERASRVWETTGGSALLEWKMPRVVVGTYRPESKVGPDAGSLVSS